MLLLAFGMGHFMVRGVIPQADRLAGSVGLSWHNWGRRQTPARRRCPTARPSLKWPAR